MGGVSVRGEARPRVRIEVLVVQRFVWCKRWMRIGAWGGKFWIRSSTTVVVEKIHARRQASERPTDRRGEPTRVQQPAGPGIGEDATLGAVNGCAWNIIMGYICTTLHRVTCN